MRILKESRVFIPPRSYLRGSGLGETVRVKSELSRADGGKVIKKAFFSGHVLGMNSDPLCQRLIKRDVSG